MQPKTLEDLIASLNPDEIEKYRALIEECLERKRLTSEYTEKIFHSLEQVSSNIRTIHNGIKDLERCGKIQSDIIEILQTDIKPLLFSLKEHKPSTN